MRCEILAQLMVLVAMPVCSLQTSVVSTSMLYKTTYILNIEEKLCKEAEMGSIT